MKEDCKPPRIRWYHFDRGPAQYYYGKMPEAEIKRYEAKYGECYAVYTQREHEEQVKFCGR